MRGVMGHRPMDNFHGRSNAGHKQEMYNICSTFVQARNTVTPGLPVNIGSFYKCFTQIECVGHRRAMDEPTLS